MSSTLPPTHLCTSCLSQVRPRTIVSSNMLVELGVWIAAIAVGVCLSFVGLCVTLPLALGFSVWRSASRRQACPTCGAPTVIPIGTPAAQRLLSAAQPPPSQPPTP